MSGPNRFLLGAVLMLAVMAVAVVWYGEMH